MVSKILQPLGTEMGGEEVAGGGSWQGREQEMQAGRPRTEGFIARHLGFASHSCQWTTAILGG